MMMGMWFLGWAYGQYIAGLLGANMSKSDEKSLLTKLQLYTDGYYQLAIYALISGLALISLSFIINKLMQETK